MLILKALVNATIWLLEKVFSALIKIFNVCHLWLFVIYLTVCGVLQLIWHTFDGEKGEFWFWMLLAATFILTIFSFLVLPKKKVTERKKDKRSPEKEKTKKETRPGLRRRKHDEYEEEEASEETERENLPPTQKPRSQGASYPRYYYVDGNSDFIIAEFADRYKLYYEVNGAWQYVRTDFKNNGGRR